MSFSKGKTNTYILQTGKRSRFNFSRIIVKSFFLRSYVMIQETDEAINISLKFYFRSSLHLQNRLKNKNVPIRYLLEFYNLLEMLPFGV